MPPLMKTANPTLPRSARNLNRRPRLTGTAGGLVPRWLTRPPVGRPVCPSAPRGDARTEGGQRLRTAEPSAACATAPTDQYRAYDGRRALMMIDDLMPYRGVELQQTGIQQLMTPSLEKFGLNKKLGKELGQIKQGERKN